MAINGVVLQKLQTLDQVLAELGSLGQVSVEQLEREWQTQRAVERDLQLLVEIVIDTCQCLISLAGQSPATSGRKAVSRCVQMGILSDYEGYGKMVQFRNFIVHRYDRVEAAILVDMVNRYLPDFTQFRDLDFVQNSKLEIFPESFVTRVKTGFCFATLLEYEYLNVA